MEGTSIAVRTLRDMIRTKTHLAEKKAAIGASLREENGMATNLAVPLFNLVLHHVLRVHQHLLNLSG